MPTLVWFRQDLRVYDNAALTAALALGLPVIPVFILDPSATGKPPLGAASRWWLHHSLLALDATLRVRGSRLILLQGESGNVLRNLVRETGATSVYWNRRYEPSVAQRDAQICDELTAAGVTAERFPGALLFEPTAIRNRQGGPFQVFTPFWRHCLTFDPPPPISLPRRKFPELEKWPASVDLAEFDLLPRSGWDKGFYDAWQPGEEGAIRQIRRFLASAMDAYADQRDFPALDGTSRLSPHLHWGEITPRSVWAAMQKASGDSGVVLRSRGATIFWNEIGWREFSYHLLTHFPRTVDQPLRPAFARFPWASDRGAVKAEAWRRGRTGYPIVDAGMRQLWATGWMHNRVRMIVASFLVKHLRLPWTLGAEWFWDTLLDADLASNTMGWQWSAGCGADAAPYFRIFAPVTQGQKFDPDGSYVRRWVPELAEVPIKYIHCPWEAPEDVLAEAAVRLGRDYPRPIVDHAEARAAALAAFKTLKETKP